MKLHQRDPRSQGEDGVDDEPLHARRTASVTASSGSRRRTEASVSKIATQAPRSSDGQADRTVPRSQDSAVKKRSRPLSYSASGVDEEREQLAFGRFMRPWLEQTAPTSPEVESLQGVAAGHFATVLSLRHGGSVAVTTDGVGTKIMIARMARSYHTVGIDCVANNVNDLICLGADPAILVDYIAIDSVDENLLEQLARGLYEGAKDAGIAIAGGEIAQVGELLAPNDGYGPVFDLVGTAVGIFPAGDKRVVDGSEVRPGDLIIGLPSSGLHSNGYSLARRALLGTAHLTLDHVLPETGRSLADELLEPTRIYVSPVRALWDAGVEIHGLVNISGGGLLNLARLHANVSYDLDHLPDPMPIFRLIQDSAAISDAEMYATFNMGIGACLVAPRQDYEKIAEVLRANNERPVVLGSVVNGDQRDVNLLPLNLHGSGDRFSNA